MPAKVRIAIDGAQSTGKTHLHRALKPSYGSCFHFVDEASRVVAARFGIRASEDWPALLSDGDRLERFFTAEEDWLEQQERGRDRLIVDSSFLLIAAYRTVFGCRVDPALLATRTYDLLLYCPILAQSEPDGFRFDSRREEVELAYRGLAAAHHRGRLVILPTFDKRLLIAASEVEVLLSHE